MLFILFALLLNTSQKSEKIFTSVLHISSKVMNLLAESTTVSTIEYCNYRSFILYAVIKNTCYLFCEI